MEILDASKIGGMLDFALHFSHNSRAEEIKKVGVQPAIGEQSKLGGTANNEKFPKVCVSMRP